MSRTIASLPDTAKRTAWIVLLTLSSVALSLIFACATPFAAFATLAALHMKRSDAFLLTGIVWLANQAVGYGLLHFPQTPDSFAWGAAIGVAAILATATAMLAERYLPKLALLTMAVAFLSAFVVYELVLYAVSFALPSSDAVFSWPIVADILKVNVLTLLGLTVFSFAAAVIGFLPDHAPVGERR
ncbi:MAG: hypothetical protein JSR24_10745 [Proteobacteria bacterium]|nr:hypothetical protein [Pseudomonadota bacterium]